MHFACASAYAYACCVYMNVCVQISYYEKAATITYLHKYTVGNLSILSFNHSFICLLSRTYIASTLHTGAGVYRITEQTKLRTKCTYNTTDDSSRVYAYPTL